MDINETKALLDLIDEAGVSFEKRRHSSSKNRRGEMGMVIANAQLAKQLQDEDYTKELLEAATSVLSDPT